MSKRMKQFVIGLLILTAFVVAGTGDLQDEMNQERINAEIIAAAPSWAVTK